MSAHAPLLGWASDANAALQRRMEALSAQLGAAGARAADDDARAGAMQEHARQLALQLRGCQSRAEAQRAEMATEEHLARILQQNGVRRFMFDSTSASF